MPAITYAAFVFAIAAIIFAVKRYNARQQQRLPAARCLFDMRAHAAPCLIHS